MKENKSIKAIIVAIILLTVWYPYTAKAASLESLKLSLRSSNNITSKVITENQTEEETTTSLETLEIKPKNNIIYSTAETLKIEIDVDELRQINNIRKKVSEHNQQKEESTQLREENQTKIEEKAEAEEAAATLAAQTGIDLSYDELVAKLNRSLNSTLSGTGEIFAKYATELGINPYLAVAIVLHETGCKWECSTLLKQCNNVGGMKGSPGCNGGSYKSFSTLEEGIAAFMNNLYKNYYAQGLTTPETIGPKYAASTTWATQVQAYMDEIEAN